LNAKADMKRVVGNKVPATTVIKKDKETRNNNGHEVKLNNKVPIKDKAGFYFF